MPQRDDILDPQAARIWRAVQAGPVTREVLERETGLPDRRIRRIVADLVTKGYPIVAIETSPGGYKVGSPAEVRAEARILRSKARAINQRADSLLNSLQEVMW